MRAKTLLPELWRYGEGTRKTEQTSGRWITYVARLHGKLHGVTAYRLRATAAPAPTPAPTTKTPAPGARTLRVGSVGDDVAYVQAAVGATPDGKFGPATRAAVIKYQSAHGLTPDGIVGPKTWASLTR